MLQSAAAAGEPGAQTSLTALSGAVRNHLAPVLPCVPAPIMCKSGSDKALAWALQGRRVLATRLQCCKERGNHAILQSAQDLRMAHLLPDHAHVSEMHDLPACKSAKGMTRAQCAAARCHSRLVRSCPARRTAQDGATLAADHWRMSAALQRALLPFLLAGAQ